MLETIFDSVAFASALYLLPEPLFPASISSPRNAS